ncbi:MAG TPA: ankyrin repeat domain-containing protein [Burkholderiales bacterium]|nr:ankyrin repeat domain-containing protein [Burkholderiales bacterium]
MTQANTEGNTPLHNAAHEGNLSSLKQLLDKGDDMNARNNAGKTPLDIADEEGHSEIALELTQRGAKFGDEC